MKDPSNSHPDVLMQGDRQAIADLLHSYAWHFDMNEPESVAGLFTEHAVVDYGPEVTPIRGRDQILAAVTHSLSEIFSATSHHITNLSIDFDSDETAQANAYVYAWHRYHDGSPDGYLWGRYQVRCQRTEPRWLLAELVLRVAGTVDFHRASMHSIGRRP